MTRNRCSISRYILDSGLSMKKKRGPASLLSRNVRLFSQQGVKRVSALLFFLSCPSMVWAHGFGQRYDLPIPLGYYLTGSVAAVFLSFAVITFFARSVGDQGSYARLNLLGLRPCHWLASPFLLAAIRAGVVFVFVVSLVAGLAGPQDPARNLLPVMVWVIWWVGMAYASALLGGVWALINPWATIFGWLEHLYQWIRPGRSLSLGVRYPPRLGVWPALVLFLVFTWCELVWTNNAVPSSLATSILVYSVITWFGMFVFGKHPWLRGGEAFSVAFGLLARFAPTEYRVADGTTCRLSAEGTTECVNHLECFVAADRKNRELNLRPPGMGLLIDAAVPVSTMFFVVLMLSTVTFDGLIATPFWQQVIETVPGWRWSMRAFFELEMLGIYRDQTTMTLGLILFPLLFFSLYWIFSAMMKWAGSIGSSNTMISVSRIAAAFVLSLVPISIAYHLAHYLSFLLIVGQVAIPLVSDPLGYGWDLFGTTDYRANIGIIGARTVWYTAVASIVLGHIIAVYIAHVVAMRIFASTRSALLSQGPMLVLMLFYTFMSLWILAQPIVE